MKKIYCILHGITDVPLQDLNGYTPLQVAKKYNLDKLVREGQLLAVESINGGGATDTALATLMSQEVIETPLPEGALQAYALGRKVNDGVIISLRLVSHGSDVVIDVADELVNGQEGQQICDLLNSEFNKSGMYFVHLEGPEMIMITDNPIWMEEGLPVEFNPLRMVGKNWLEYYNDFPAITDLLKIFGEKMQAHDINILREDLEENYINGVIFTTRGKMPVLQKAHNAEKKILFTPSNSSMGVAKLLGIDAAHMPPERTHYENIDGFMSQLDDVLKSKDEVYCEFFYIWDSTYKGNLREKIKRIEYLDNNFVELLMKYCLGNDIKLILTPLVNSDIRMCEHTDGSVPVVIYPSSDKSTLDSFDEKKVSTVDKVSKLSSINSFVRL